MDRGLAAAARDVVICGVLDADFSDLVTVELEELREADWSIGKFSVLGERQCIWIVNGSFVL